MPNPYITDPDVLTDHQLGLTAMLHRVILTDDRYDILYAILRAMLDNDSPRPRVRIVLAAAPEDDDA
jgi:hypothetical protein